MRAFDFLQQPGVALIEALLLKFQPNFMDVLPLYIVLLIAFPLVLWLLLHWPIVALALVRRALCGGAAFLLESSRLPDRYLVL